MSNPRQMIAWLLLVLVVVVAGGAAALGVSQAPSNVPLTQAVDNTLAAPNYSEVVTESTAQGKQTDYLTYQAPDRLGGYIQSGSRRTYVYVIGDVEYQSLTVSASAGDKHLTLYKQPSEGAATLDPAHNYLRYASLAKNPKLSGATTTFTVTQSGQVGTFKFTVAGSYVSSVSLTVKTASVSLVISQVGSSPPVALPAGARILTAPPSGTGAGGAAGAAAGAAGGAASAAGGAGASGSAGSASGG
jgi:hypothetical protein